VVNWASGAQVSYSHFSHFLLQLLINWVFFSDITISSSCAKPCVPLPLAWGCSRGQNHQRLLVHRWKTFLMSLDLSRARHPWVFSMKPFPLFLPLLHTFGWLPSILILHPAFPLHKILKLFHRFIPSSNLWRVGNDLALDDPFFLPL